MPSDPRADVPPAQRFENLKVIVGENNEGRQVSLPEPRNDIEEGQGQASAPVKKFNFTGEQQQLMEEDQPAVGHEGEGETANAAEPMEDDCQEKRHCDRRFQTEDITNYPKKISRDVSSGKMDRMIGLLLPKIRISMPGSLETLKPFTCAERPLK